MWPISIKQYRWPTWISFDSHGLSTPPTVAPSFTPKSLRTRARGIQIVRIVHDLARDVNSWAVHLGITDSLHGVSLPGAAPGISEKISVKTRCLGYHALQTWCPVRHDSLGSILDAKTAPGHRGTSILCCDEVMAKPKGMTHLAIRDCESQLGEHQPNGFFPAGRSSRYVKFLPWKVGFVLVSQGRFFEKHLEDPGVYSSWRILAKL